MTPGERKRAVENALRAGLPAAEIRRRHGVTERYVEALSFGMSRHPGRYTGMSLADLMRRNVEIVWRGRAGDQPCEIAAAFGLSPAQVRNILTAAGVEYGTDGDPWLYRRGFRVPDALRGAYRGLIRSRVLTLTEAGQILGLVPREPAQ